MAYVTADGKVLQQRPWSIQRLVELFWGFFAAVAFFFQSLVGLEGNRSGGGNSGRRGGGSSGSGPGNGPDGGPKRRIKTMADVQECNLPGGG